MTLILKNPLIAQWVTCNFFDLKKAEYSRKIKNIMLSSFQSLRKWAKLLSIRPIKTKIQDAKLARLMTLP